MTYELILTPEAVKHLNEWRKSGQKKILKKIAEIFEELKIHPHRGTGKVEQLRGDLSGFWSRRIDKGARIVYKIENERVVVIVVSLKGHYADK
ncbi:MAG: Txe/YoeB family addiction module toxin [Muribaculaceae bacterium]|nr:Txe/YoeB family addiction module toxin [Muribaculaceae bacterium]